jgi:uncharacterized protein
MHHALYDARITHHRQSPDHLLRQRAIMACLDLDHLEELNGVSPLLGRGRSRLIQWRRADYLGDSTHALKDDICELVKTQLGISVTGSVIMLANLRTLWWCFNPIVTYWCFDPEGRGVALVLSVTNTPWHEHHAYVVPWVDAAQQPWTFPKALHVSPFFEMNYSYRLQASLPQDHISLGLDLLDAGGSLAFGASLQATRMALTNGNLIKLLTQTPTQKVSLGIYAHAARLRAKGTRFVPHPKKHMELPPHGSRD